MNKSKIEKIILKDSVYGEPMLEIHFRTKNSKLIYKNILTTAFAINECNKNLRKLNSGMNITFDSFKQYNKLLNTIANRLNIPYSFSKNN